MAKKQIITAKERKKSKSKSFPIIAIGASAGGLEAVSQLLKNIPPDTGMAYVYIQHLDPSHESKLPVLLSQVTQMKVQQARHRLHIEKNNVYVIPPNKDMSIVDGVLTLNARSPKPVVHMPIDKFFISLAERQRSGAIGIVLSGNANDGTRGLKAIKMAGGLTFVQDDSAKFQSMPKSAIAEGVVDMVLSPQEIAREIKRISQQPDAIQIAMGDLDGKDVSDEDEDLVQIIQHLKKSVGVDFTHYKLNTIKRRIMRRMLLYKLETLKDYYLYLKKHNGEVDVLYQDLLINVTSFFRDPDAMEYLKKTLLPKILKSKGPNDPVRIWVPACSSGEEAYSLAMVIMEILGDKKGANAVVQIFATDLSEPAIAKARLGLYTRNDVLDISPRRLQRFFTKVDGTYRIVKSIRDLCVFAPHNIFKDPPFSRLDLISCCNLMIYLDNVLQKKILATFHYALNPNGYLLLGKSEAVSASARLFSQVEKKYKIFMRKKEGKTPALLDMIHRVPGAERVEGPGARKITIKEPVNEADVERIVDSILLTQFAPACVVVNNDLEILQFRGSTSLFLEPSPGKASLNLLKMARPGLAFELRNAIHKSGKSGDRTRKTGLEIKNKGSTHQVSIEVVPLKSENEEKLFLVLFEEDVVQNQGGIKSSLTKDKLVKKLQAELHAAKEDMRSIIEEQETSNEELQSANEEIVSSNEELQSINEELETSKEEVESTNEELMTINAEMQVRNEQLAESYEYAEAVFRTIREPVVVLDEELRVKSANRSFYNTFHAKEAETEGVYIYDLGSKQWNIPKLRELLEEIIPRNAQFDDFEVTNKFPIIGERVMLLNARRIVQKVHKQQLILLAIEDVTENKKAQKIITEREAWFRNVADNAAVMIWVADTNKEYTFLNKTWREYTGQVLEHQKGNERINAIHKDDLDTYHRIFDASFSEQKPFNVEYRLRRHDGEYRWVQDAGKPTFSPDNEFTGYLGSCTEIHDNRLMRDELDRKVKQRTHDLVEANKNLQNSNSELEQFAYVASHDLQEPLRKIMTFADRLDQFKNDLPEAGKNYINKITVSSQRMTRLIDDLLNFSRISSTHKNFVKTDLNVILKDVMADFDVIILDKKARLHVEKLPVVPVIPLQMEQLFHNLISNALKFSKPNAPPEVSISSHTLSPEGVSLRKGLDRAVSYVEIIFKDNGIGFNDEFAEQVFVIFQRVHDNSLKIPGTGIGLALCRKIVQNHGGDIYVVSKENEGAAFHVILPMEQL